MEMPGRGLEPLRISPPDPKSGASANSATLANFTNRAQFIAARDSRNRRVPGLCLRGERYYAHLWVDVGNGTKTSRRFSLRDSDNQPVQTLSAAREALEIKRHKRRENQLPTSGHKPLFRDYCAIYFEKAKVQRKRRDTIAGEREAVARWCDHLGHVRIDQIAIPLITNYIDKRLKGGIFRPQIGGDLGAERQSRHNSASQCAKERNRRRVHS